MKVPSLQNPRRGLRSEKRSINAILRDSYCKFTRDASVRRALKIYLPASASTAAAIK